MALPEPFSDIKHLQLVVRRYLNKQIREDFRDLHNENGGWDPEINTTRGQMLRALLHEDSDPIHVTSTRLMLYYFVYGKAQALQAPFFGTPIQDYQETFRYHPQIKLFFMEDTDDAEDPYKPLRSEITFRIMGETEETITEAKAKTLANKISANFANNNGFKWKRGKETWTYTDLSKGYRLKLFVWNEVEAKRVIEQILDIQGYTPDWDTYLRDATQRKHLKTSIIPKTKKIYGKNRKLPREKPVGSVRFRWAELHVWGIPKPITLVDRSGYRHNPLVTA
jgi:hypothetical protein